MAELCKSCVHQKVCMKDKNLVGDVFVPGNPMFFDNAKLFAQYEERKKTGFPCDDYLSTDVAPARHGRWVTVKIDEDDEGVPTLVMAGCDQCHMGSWTATPFCGYCGAKMEETE